MFYRPVCSASEVMQIILSVLKLRAHCPTLVHTDSSRSHLIVTLTISSKSPNALALGETHSYTHSQTHISINDAWKPHIPALWLYYSSIQPAGYRVPRRTCNAPPRRSGGVHAVAVPTLLPATHLTNSLQAPPPLPALHLHIPRVPPRGTVSHRLHSGPSCSWWTWQGVSVLVRLAQCLGIFLEFVGCIGTLVPECFMMHQARRKDLSGK